MFKAKCLQALTLAIAGLGLGLAPVADASAGSCRSDRSSYHDRSYHRDYHRGHNRGWSQHTRHRTHNQDYSHSRSKVSYHHNSGKVRFSVNFGSRSSCDYDRGYQQPRYQERTSCRKTVVVHHAPQPTGYWTRVYRSPVYETRYDDCGRPYRVCVRAGYYERVWVDTTYRH